MSRSSKYDRQGNSGREKSERKVGWQFKVLFTFCIQFEIDF